MAHKLLSSVPSIYKQGAGEDKGETARLQAYIGAIAIGDLVKSTLGPKGMDKILQPLPGEGASTATTVTNDGATILQGSTHALFGSDSYDDVRGATLNKDMVREARRVEMEFFEQMGV